MKACARSKLACQIRSAIFGADSSVSTYWRNSWRRSAPSAASKYCSPCARARSIDRRDCRMPSNARSTSCWRATESSEGSWRSHAAVALAETIGSAVSRELGVRNANMAPMSATIHRASGARGAAGALSSTALHRHVNNRHLSLVGPPRERVRRVG